MKYQEAKTYALAAGVTESDIEADGQSCDWPFSEHLTPAPRGRRAQHGGIRPPNSKGERER